MALFYQSFYKLQDVHLIKLDDFIMRGKELFVTMVNQGGNTTLINKHTRESSLFTFECDANEMINKIK